MTAVLISIQPKWCELIASGEKTVEVRKTRPKIETPFKCYIYCTKGKGDCLWRWGGIWYDTQDPTHRPNRMDRKVIGEFVCDDVTKILNFGSRFSAEGRSECELNTIARGSCLDFVDMRSYFGLKDGYAWHISDLKIYDKPKELSEFSKYGFGDPVPLKRPPQSWMYVEALQ